MGIKEDILRHMKENGNKIRERLIEDSKKQFPHMSEEKIVREVDEFLRNADKIIEKKLEEPRMRNVKITKDRFIELVINKVKKDYPKAKIKVDEEGKIRIKTKDVNDSVLSVNNILTKINHGEMQIIDGLKSITDVLKMESTLAKPEYEKIKNKIILVPRPVDFAAVGKKEMKGEIKDNIAKRNFVAGIAIYYALDFKNATAFMSEKTFKEMKKSIEEIEEQAIKNLKKLKINYKTNERNGVVIIGGDDNVSSLIFMPKKIRKEIKKYFGDEKVIIGCPYRNGLIVERYSMENYLGMRGNMENMWRKNADVYPVSNKPFMMTEDNLIEDFRHKDLPEDAVGFGVMGDGSVFRI